MSEQHNPQTLIPTGAPGAPLVWQKPVNEWQALGDTFETMGKVGLAMTVGFAAAGIFCKLVDSGAVKLPSVASLVTQPGQPPQS